MQQSDIDKQLSDIKILLSPTHDKNPAPLKNTEEAKELPLQT